MLPSHGCCHLMTQRPTAHTVSLLLSVAKIEDSSLARYIAAERQLLIRDALHYLPGGKLKVLALTQFMPLSYQLDPMVDWHIWNTLHNFFPVYCRESQRAQRQQSAL